MYKPDVYTVISIMFKRVNIETVHVVTSLEKVYEPN